MTTDAENLLAHVPEDGSTVGNRHLRKKLEWDDARYWAARDELVQLGRLQIGRGMGGSVLRPPVQIGGVTGAERDLYEDIARLLREKWCKDLSFQESFVEITAQQGRRHTGGTWTRPDIVVVNVSTYPYLPGKQVDVITFEVKTADNCDVPCVYEALAHLRAATRAYVFISAPKPRTPDLEKRLELIKEEAARHGVGMIIAGQHDDYDSWEFLVDAPAPNTQSIAEFLSEQISDGNRNKLALFVR